MNTLPLDLNNDNDYSEDYRTTDIYDEDDWCNQLTAGQIRDLIDIRFMSITATMHIVQPSRVWPDGGINCRFWFRNDLARQWFLSVMMKIEEVELPQKLGWPNFPPMWRAYLEGPYQVEMMWPGAEHLDRVIGPADEVSAKCVDIASRWFVTYYRRDRSQD